MGREGPEPVPPAMKRDEQGYCKVVRDGKATKKVIGPLSWVICKSQRWNDNRQMTNDKLVWGCPDRGDSLRISDCSRVSRSQKGRGRRSLFQGYRS